MTTTSATIQETPSPAGECPCTFNMDPQDHDALLSIETAGPLEAIELVAELAMCEMHSGFDQGDFQRFVAQHNWENPAAVARLTILLDDLSEGFCRGTR